jgi:hypothetical protein
MKKLTSEIKIGSFSFSYVHGVTIESSWENLTDTAKITLPQNLRFNQNKIRDLIKSGMPVSIALGYDGENTTLFTGFVTGISPKAPLEITCEDYAWQLKQNVITDTIANCTIERLLQKHFNGIASKFLNANLGTFTINKASQAKVLDDIKRQFGLRSFFRGSTLVVGLIYDPEKAKEQVFNFQRNIVSNNLTFKSKDDVRLRVTAISNQSNGQKLEIIVGDADGEQRTLNFYNLTAADLKENANRELERLKYDGYRGTFTAFGEPIVRHGDIVRLTNPEESDRTGRFWVDAVTYEFNQSGFRQTIKLGAAT